MVKDIRTGSSGSYPVRASTTARPRRFFAAVAPALPVPRPEPPCVRHVQECFAVMGSTLYFQANGYPDGSNNGVELWKSDGTADGTVLVKDIRTGINSGFPVSCTVAQHSPRAPRSHLTLSSELS